VNEPSLESAQDHWPLVYITLGILATFTSVTIVMWSVSLVIGIP